MKVIKSQLDWDSLWMSLATNVAKKSKDPSTKVGSVIVSRDNRQVSIGYNGPPSQIADKEEFFKRPLKYTVIIHSEVNAILNAKRDLESNSLFCTHFPCQECVKLIIQAGITRVVYKNELDRNYINYELSEYFFREAGVVVDKFRKGK